MNDYLLDSDVIIWFLRGKKEVVAFLKNLPKERLLGCSPLSIIEIKLGVRKGEEDATNQFFNALKIWEMDREIAEEAAGYIVSYRKKGIALDFVDATIAATCKLRNLTLLTYNSDHYPMQDIAKYKMPQLTM
ncbi:MAG: type II toxin-antitoxin system VapC family toxin [Nitrospirae bacterium]|nr:MAG: type II toxin-antitoxin system VapC family toxin [Nitrospirota bacterium]